MYAHVCACPGVYVYARGCLPSMGASERGASPHCSLAACDVLLQNGGQYSSQRESNAEGRPAHRGVVGLYNLGNTCFMNSTLQVTAIELGFTPLVCLSVRFIDRSCTPVIYCVQQCLSNTPIYSSFFISGRFANDVNKDNPLGNGGRLAAEYATLLQTVWSGTITYCFDFDISLDTLALHILAVSFVARACACVCVCVCVYVY